MSASAKPVEKVLKSFLAIVLAVSFCPLIPAEKAQAQETEGSSEPAAPAQVASEGGTEAADSDGESPAPTAEGDSSDDDGIALQADKSGTPIVDWTTSGTCRWMIDASIQLIIAPSSGSAGQLEDWGCGNAPWSAWSKFIRSVSFDGTISAPTASNMFSGCSSLTSLDLSKFDTSSATSMSNMFSGCSSLGSLDLSSLDTSKVTDMRYMLYGCSSLTSLDLSKFDTSNVANMSGMFCNCSSLESIDLSSLNTSKVTSMYTMFYGCASLTSLDLSSFDTSSATSMSNMFYGCRALLSLDLSGFDTSNVTNMDNMFFRCSSLTFLDLSGFNTSNVTSTRVNIGGESGGMFSKCSSLMALNLSGWDTSKMESMGHMFDGCTSLTSLDLSSFNTSKVLDMSYMFSECTSLTALDFSSFDTSWVFDMEDMFSGCSSLIALNLSSFKTPHVTDMRYMFRNCSALKSLDLSSFDTSSVTDMRCMFDGCSGLRSVSLGEKFSFRGAKDSYQCGLSEPKGEGVTGRWVTSADDVAYAPWGVPSNIEATYIAQEKGSRAWSLGGSWKWQIDAEGCLNIEPMSDVDEGVIDGSGMEGSGWPWLSRAKEIKSVYVGNRITLKSSAMGMFFGCSELTAADLSHLKAVYVDDVRTMFYGCSSLVSLDLSNFNSSMAQSGICITNASYMFSGCSCLASLDLSGLDTSKATDISHMFDGCTSLRTVTLGEKFSFNGAKDSRQCDLPTPAGDGLTGRWASSADGIAYTPDGIPSNVAAVYVAQGLNDEGWNQLGSCVWRVDEGGCLTVKPFPGSEKGALGSWSDTPPLVRAEGLDRLRKDRGRRLRRDREEHVLRLLRPGIARLVGPRYVEGDRHALHVLRLHVTAHGGARREVQLQRGEGLPAVRPADAGRRRTDWSLGELGRWHCLYSRWDSLERCCCLRSAGAE